MDIGALHVFRSFDPTLNIDVTHFLASEECIIFQYDIIRVPDNDA